MLTLCLLTFRSRIAQVVLTLCSQADGSDEQEPQGQVPSFSFGKYGRGDSNLPTFMEPNVDEGMTLSDDEDL